MTQRLLIWSLNHQDKSGWKEWAITALLLPPLKSPRARGLTPNCGTAQWLNRSASRWVLRIGLSLSLLVGLIIFPCNSGNWWVELRPHTWADWSQEATNQSCKILWILFELCVSHSWTHSAFTYSHRHHIHTFLLTNTFHCTVHFISFIKTFGIIYRLCVVSLFCHIL